MATQIGVGISTKLDSYGAGREAGNYAIYHLGKKELDLVFVFISTIYNQIETINGIRSVVKDTPLFGCSTAGSLTSYGAFRSSVSVCVLASDSLEFGYGIGPASSKNPRLSGMEASKQSISLRNLPRSIYILLYDCLSGNGTDVLRGSQEILGTGFHIIGGAATSDSCPEKTYQYLNNTIYTDSVIGLLIGGSINVEVGKAHGWQPIGMPHKITKAKSNIVKTIDKRTAIELYEEYLGKSYDEIKIEGISKLGSMYPLGMRIKESDEYITRAPLRIDEDGGLILTAEIPEREDINLMIGDKNFALGATKKACIEALKNINKSRIKFAIVFSDIARLRLLRKDAGEEAEIIKEVLGKDVPFFGCYTCGEYVSVGAEEYQRQTYLHNHAISVAIFSE